MSRAGTTRRIGITKFVGDVVDDTKEFVDSVLDRIKDSERDLRDSAARALRYDEEREDIETLKAELERLSERIAALSTPEPESRRPSTGGAGH